MIYTLVLKDSTYQRKRNTLTYLLLVLQSIQVKVKPQISEHLNRLPSLNTLSYFTHFLFIYNGLIYNIWAVKTKLDWYVLFTPMLRITCMHRASFTHVLSIYPGQTCFGEYGPQRTRTAGIHNLENWNILCIVSTRPGASSLTMKGNVLPFTFMLLHWGPKGKNHYGIKGHRIVCTVW